MAAGSTSTGKINVYDFLESAAKGSKGIKIQCSIEVTTDLETEFTLTDETGEVEVEYSQDEVGRLGERAMEVMVANRRQYNRDEMAEMERIEVRNSLDSGIASLQRWREELVESNLDESGSVKLASVHLQAMQDWSDEHPLEDVPQYLRIQQQLDRLRWAIKTLANNPGPDGEISERDLHPAAMLRGRIKQMGARLILLENPYHLGTVGTEHVSIASQLSDIDHQLASGANHIDLIGPVNKLSGRLNFLLDPERLDDTTTALTEISEDTVVPSQTIEEDGAYSAPIAERYEFSNRSNSLEDVLTKKHTTGTPAEASENGSVHSESLVAEPYELSLRVKSLVDHWRLELKTEGKTSEGGVVRPEGPAAERYELSDWLKSASNTSRPECATTTTVREGSASPSGKPISQRREGSAFETPSLNEARPPRDPRSNTPDNDRTIEDLFEREGHQDPFTD
ncbi:hypothetical protein QBC37DRAFT_392200, partial [Rhypophila decipiens]